MKSVWPRPACRAATAATRHNSPASPDPADRRVRQIVATEPGRALLCTLEERLARAEAHVLAGLAAGERQTRKSQLARLAAHAHDPVLDTCAVVEDVGARRRN